MKRGMKRGVAAALAAGVLLAPATAPVPVAAADTAQQGLPAAGAGSTQTAATVDVVTTASSANSTAALAAETLNVRILTLEEVLTRALEVNSNYKILEYKWRILDLQEENQQDMLDKLPQQPIAPPNPGDYIDPSANISDIIEGIIDWTTDLLQNPGISQQELDYNRDQLETAIDKLNSQKRTTRLQQDEAREGVKMMVTQMYVGLLSLKQQLYLVDATVEQQKQAVNNAFLKYRLGIISMEAHDQELRKLEDAQRNADSLRIQYEKQLAQLLFLLDLPQDKTYDLAAVSPDPEQSVLPPENVDELVANSFKVRQARETLRQARLDFDLTEDYAPNNATGDRQVDSTKYQVKIAEEQLKQTERTVRAQIDSLYRSAADAKAAYEQAQKKWTDMSTDYQRMLLRYELGLIARQDLTNMELAVQQAQVQLETAKYQYFLALAQLSALKAGYVPVT